MDKTVFDTGWTLLEQMAPGQPDTLAKAFADLAPELPHYIIAFGYGEVLSRPGLDLKSRQLATVSALASMGTAPEQLGFHIGAALRVGLSPQEIIEAFYLVAVFAGFPAALNALAAARKVFTERGVLITPVEAYGTAKNRRERGLQTLEETSKGAGQKVLDSLKDIAPELGEFIMDFSYGDVISRRILTPRQKELVMVAAAASRGTMRPQLMVHIRAGLAVGLTRQEIVEICIQMAVYAGFPAALNALGAAREVFES